MLERQAQEALSAGEVDSPTVPARAMDLVVAAWIDEDAAPERSAFSALAGDAATVPNLRRNPRPGIESTRLWASW